MIISVIDTATSIVSGLVTFAVLGAMSHDLKVGIDDVVDKGPGLVFITYPEALSKLPFSHVFSFAFFFMLYLLGLGSAVSVAKR